MIGLVARRELTERLRSRLFLGVNALLALLIIGGAALPALLGDEPEAVRIGAADPPSRAVADAALVQAAARGVDLSVSTVPGERAGRQELRAGDLDVLLVEGTRVVAVDGVGEGVQTTLNAAAQQLRLEDALDTAGVPPAERAELLAPAPLDVVLLDADAEEDLFGPAAIVTLIAVAVLYGLLAMNGQWVAQGIIEEKQSRVVELLLSSLRPWQLLGGKLLGLGILGLVQVGFLTSVGLGALAVFSGTVIPAEARFAVLLAGGWYVLGYGVYACLFAMAGAIAARMEDLQSTTAPVILALVGALFAAQTSIGAPRSTFATVAAYVPLTAPMTQPVRMATGTGSVAEGLAAAVLTIAFVCLLVPVAGRLYRGGVLQTRRRISLRAAWTGAER